MNRQQENKQNKINKKVQKLLQAGKSKYFTLFDLFIYAFLIVFVLSATLFVFYLPKPTGNAFVVFYNNRKLVEYKLNQDAEYIFYINEQNEGKIEVFNAANRYKEYNKIVVKAGKVAITETDCKDKSCQVRGAIDYGDIICLPHRLKITVVNLQTDIDFNT